MRVRILSRASDLARLQAMLVSRALHEKFPELDVHLLTRASAGDRDGTTPLAEMPDKGAFTSDLSDALLKGHADLVVHSWKDLPLEDRDGTTVAATLERADPRDLLLVRRDVVHRRPATLTILSSSPRRSWLLEQALPDLLPWRVDALQFAPVRGNIATRLTRLTEGRGDALVVAKAALDRLLGFGPPFEEAARTVRAHLTKCVGMVLPLREVPGAPAQGALAIEAPVRSRFAEQLAAISHRPTWDAVQEERAVLARHGGGCHEALGATVLPREYGRVVSIKGRLSSGASEDGWSLTATGIVPPKARAAEIWPRPEERERATRRPLDVAAPPEGAGFWVARAEALPEAWTVTGNRLVWAAGSTTWRKLAARGIWVHGCADGLGDAEPPGIDALAGYHVAWHRLTHRAAASADPDALATYEVHESLPDDLPSRTHFFWTSGTQFLQAIERWPELVDRWHASGPGRTWQTLCRTLGHRARARVWL
ncbi:MAG TPA: hydroxymethylbilane synthase, partial [Vicinamibacterales bacterium]|nr:hydroxymethylbilane synthase [Vicinamibacterales bacterium]